MPGRTLNRSRGFTLLEVLLALVLLVFAFLALMEALSIGLFVGSDHESQLVATRLAEEKMEELRNKSYSSIASEAKAAVSGFTAFQREVVVTTPLSDLKEIGVNVYWFNKDDELSVDLVTYRSNI